MCVVVWCLSAIKEGQPPPTPLPWEIRLRIALDSAAGLAFLHDNHVIHRDFKAPNVLLDDVSARLLGCTRHEVKVKPTGVRRNMALVRPPLLCHSSTKFILWAVKQQHIF